MPEWPRSEAIVHIGASENSQQPRQDRGMECCPRPGPGVNGHFYWPRRNHHGAVASSMPETTPSAAEALLPPDEQDSIGHRNGQRRR
jgi:hypothetical protein